MYYVVEDFKFGEDELKEARLFAYQKSVGARFSINITEVLTDGIVPLRNVIQSFPPRFGTGKRAGELREGTE